MQAGAEGGRRADGRRLRPRARGSHPGAPGGETAVSVRSRAKSPRWSATRSGYQSRAFVTFGKPISLGGYDPESRRDVMELAHLHARHHRHALQGAAHGGRRRGDAALDHHGASSKRAPTRSIETLARRRGEPGRHVRPRRRSRQAPSRSAARNIIHVERGGRFRVRERTVLRYYARTIQHLLTASGRAPRTH